MGEISWSMFFRMMMVEEKAAYDKYKMAMEATDSPSLKKVFERLMNEEAVHAEMLEGEYQKLMRKLERGE